VRAERRSDLQEGSAPVAVPNVEIRQTVDENRLERGVVAVLSEEDGRELALDTLEHLGTQGDGAYAAGRSSLSRQQSVQVGGSFHHALSCSLPCAAGRESRSDETTHETL
jgi:hypothetical protein